MVKEYARHPLSEAWGNMTAEEFAELKDDVESNGVKDAVTIWQGMVLDGWQRYSAANALGMDCPFEHVTLTADEARAFVISRAIRRSSTKSQRAMAAVLCNEWSPRGHKSATSADLKTSAEIAQEVGTSVRMVEQAKTVVRRAIPEVIQAVKDGDVSLRRAAEVVKSPKRKQKDALANPRPAKAWKPVAPLPRPTTGPSQEAFDEVKEKLAVLIEENDRLTDRLAVAAMDPMDATDDEKGMHATILAELRADGRTLRAELDGARATRDSLMTENSELKAQIKQDQARARKQS